VPRLAGGLLKVGDDQLRREPRRKISSAAQPSPRPMPPWSSRSANSARITAAALPEIARGARSTA